MNDKPKPLRLASCRPFLCDRCNRVHIEFYNEDGTVLLAIAQVEPEYALELGTFIAALGWEACARSASVQVPTGVEPMPGSNDDDVNKTKH